MKYPTKKQILEEPRPTFKRGTMKTLSDWKKALYKEWNTQSINNQMFSLEALAIVISRLYSRPEPSVSFTQGADRYTSNGWRIYSKNGSIISFLHELAHHLFGPNELTACRWSVWLYQLRFRKDYEQLIWQEHTLVKPYSRTKIKKSQ